MFGAQRLGSVLQDHPIFEHLKETENLGQLKGEETEQLLHVHGGNLSVWNESRSCLLTTNLRGVLDDESEEIKVQSLICQDAPIYHVKKIIFNSTCSHVALIGSRGVTVLVLPQRWGCQADYEGGKSKIICKSIPIAERFFVSNISVQLVQASWYPLATSPVPHICLLTSDNMLRIYNIRRDPQVPVQSHKLSPSPDSNISLSSSRISLLSMYSVTCGLGETVIAFDFAPPIDHTPRPLSKLSSKSPERVRLQPIYLLQGNGDVLLLLTSLTNNRFAKGILQGPLIMQPMAEDNYGVDSCSIYVMPSTPTTVVIATSTGKLHHCIALGSSSDGDDDSLSEIDSQSIRSRLSSIKRDTMASEDLKAPTLYVYETVELELDLTMEDNDSENRFIDLFGDPVLGCRYHCCTAVGVHTVALPWLIKMNAFVQADDQNKDNLTDLMHDEPCVVEHILCTKPTSSSCPCLIKGFSVVSDPMCGPALLCLTADGHCASLPLLTTFSSHPAPLLTARPDQPTAPSSPLKHMNEPNFEDRIKSLLRRDLSQPIIRAGDWDSASSDKECLQLVTRATRILRDEYILKQKLARDAISKRIQLLNELKAQQSEELTELDTFRETLTDAAERIASDYEDCQDRQEALMHRLEKVTKLVKDRDPVLSRAEVDMTKELKGIADKLQNVDNRIKQLKIKEEYQAKQFRMHDHSGGQRDGDRTPGLPNSSLRTEKFKHVLLEEGDKISELIKKLNNMNGHVGL